MVAEHTSNNISEEKDSNILSCPDGSEFPAGHSCKSVFDVVRTGEVSDIESLVEKVGAEILSARDDWGYTPAHWAALDGNVEVMRYLVERSAPVDLSCLGTQGPRPIHWACRKGHAGVVQVLLQVGLGTGPDLEIGMAEDIGVDQSTISKTLSYVLKRIVEKRNEWVKFASTAMSLDSAKMEWQERYSFPAAIGAVDCTRILIRKPHMHGNEYVNRKGHHSLNVQATCNVKEEFGLDLYTMPEYGETAMCAE
ncbi:Uncharacterized protein GBIM_20898, partial [Gryllus bimaculatus]